MQIMQIMQGIAGKFGELCSGLAVKFAELCCKFWSFFKYYINNSYISVGTC